MRISFAILVTLASLFSVACGPGSDIRLTTFPNLGGNFHLTDQDGNSWELSNVKGSVALLYFGFTTCPDACPVAISKIARASRILGDARALKTLFVSVDRDRDTPTVLKNYVSAFSIPVTGLTGSREEINEAVRCYGADYKIERSDSAVEYQVSHTTSLFLIDQDGKLRYIFPHDVEPSQIASGVQQLLDGRH